MLDRVRAGERITRQQENLREISNQLLHTIFLFEVEMTSRYYFFQPFDSTLDIGDRIADTGLSSSDPGS